MNRIFVLAVFTALVPAVYADQGSFTNSGGSSGSVIVSTVAAPAGTLSISGSSLTFLSSDGTTSILANITSGAPVESCSGGGKGGNVHCGYSLTAYFSGTLTVNGQAQAINGVTYQSYPVGGSATGLTAYNSAYTPFYYSDSGAILRSDDLMGTNQISYNGGFYGAMGIALDSAGRIYVADTYNSRVVRMDDMNGTNFTAFGTYGSGPGQFFDPQGIAVDSNGEIYVMDTNNARIVRMDDMNGTNFTAFGSPGSGVGQFNAFISIAVDSSNRIYVADGGNRRVVRFDDMNFTNWIALTQSPPVNGSSTPFGSPAAVAVDASGRIYVADDGSYAPEVIRVDDMTGTNWTSLYVGPTGTTGLNSISVDSTGMAMTGGGGAKTVDNMAAELNSSGAVGPVGSYYVFGVTPVPLPGPRPSAVSFTPNTLSFTQNVGTSGSQTITIANFGGSPLNLGTISASGGFTETSNCPGSLAGGSNCAVTVSFAPSVTGSVSGQLYIADDSFNLGTAQSLILTGLGTAPVASVTPASVTFSSTVEGATSSAKTVTLSNTGTGPMQVASLTVSGPFNQTNTCSASIAPAGSCTISITFAPTAVGSATGAVTIADNAGAQTVGLTGTGSAQVTLSSSSLSLGTVVVGSASAAKTVTLTNHGSTSLNFSGIAATTGFAMASNTCGTSIAAGANCVVGVTFSPASIGAATGTLMFTDSALNSPQTVSLSGTGSTPVTLSATSLSFSSTPVGNTSSAKTVTLTNNQSVALNFSGITTSAGFAVASNTCGTSIAAGGSCVIGVTFSPTVTGTTNGTLTFTDDAPGSPQTVSLSGSGTTAAQVTVSPSALSLGTVTVGKTSAAGAVTLTNHQSGALSFTSIAASSGFAVASNTCGTSLAGGASCTVGVTFSPTSTGAATGTLTFKDNAGNSPQTVSLSGTGSSPVTVSPATLNLGSVAVGSTSSGQAVTITNNGTSSVVVNSVTVTGDFAETNACSSIAGGGSCTVSVTFTPVLAGTRTGTLTVNLSAGAQTVSLTGTGSAGSGGSQTGVLSLSPASLNFSGYTIGDNPSKTVTVKNVTAGPVGLAGIAMSGDASLTDKNSCGSLLAAGATCSVTVTFKPVAYGTFTGTLTVTEGSGAQDSISVTGNSSPDN